MKKLFILLFFSTTFCIVNAQENQEANVEGGINGIQIGYIGFSLNNEARLARKLTLKSEVSFYPTNLRKNADGYIVYPYFNLETRWYSNLDRRFEKGKKTEGNTGNAWSLTGTYSPNWIIITNQNTPAKRTYLSVGPSYIIRRTLGNHFNVEGNIGATYNYIFNDSKDYLLFRGGSFSFGAGIQIGYHFVRKN